MKTATLAALVAAVTLLALIQVSAVAGQSQDGSALPTTRTVTGTDIGHYTNGTSPVDLSAVTVAALIPNNSGGYTTIAGTGTSAGTFTIRNVPTGSYVLQLGNLYLVTSNTTVDADFTFGFRSNAVPADSSTTLTFDLTNLDSWQSTDVFEVVCTNNAAFIEYDGTTGQTVLSGTVPYSPFFTENLSDGSQGDQYVILQLSTQNLGSFPFTGAARALFPTKFTQAQGSDTPIDGALTTLAQVHRFEANINGADLTAQSLAANPGASLISTALVLDAYPGSIAKGERTSTPDLVGYNLSNFVAGPNITTNSDFGRVSYGDPFPPNWPLFVLYVWTAQESYVAPGATNSLFLSTFVQGYNTALPTATTPIKPLVGVVNNPTINGNNFFADQSGVGFTPTLRWSPPSVGKASFYDVQILQLSNVGGSTAETAFSRVRTANTSLTIPPGLLTPGASYVFVIRPWSIPGLNFARTPFLSGPVNAFSDVISGLIQP